MLAILPLPTLAEWRRHWTELDAPQRRFIECIEGRGVAGGT
jgi:hypothetical protein